MMRITTLLLASMLTMMAGAIVAPALPEITLHFRGIPNHELMARLVITLPALAIALTSFLMGMVVDRRGRVPVLTGSLLLYLFAGTSVYFIHQPYLILITRFLLGIAVSGIMTAVLTLIGDYYKGEERNRVMGIQGGFMGIGGVVFISLSGFLADFSWQTPFLLYGFALPILILSFFYITEPDNTKNHPDKKGAESNPKKPASFHWPMVLLVIFSGFTGIVFFFMMPVQLPYLLKEIPDLPNWKIGIGIASSTMSAAVVAMNLRKIRRWISNPQMYVVAFFFMSIGFFFVSQAHTYTQFLGALLIAGLGTGLLMPAPSLWIVAIAPLSHRGRLVGLVSAFSFFGQFASPLLFQPLIRGSSVRHAFFVASGMLMLLAIGYLLFHFYYVRKLRSEVELY